MSEPLRDVCRDYGWSATELAAAGGEDYCLLCTVDPRAFSDLAAAFAAEFHRPLHAIGVATGDGALTYLRGGAAVRLDRRGFDHFKT
jgi:thiamine-monophosphate kinase